MLDRLKRWARILRRDTTSLYLAARDPRTPFLAKALAGFVVAYALSPVDLIPDFIPVFGYLDDLLLIPVGLWVAVRLIPPDVMRDCRARAAQTADRPASVGAVVFIVLIWAALAAFAGWFVFAAAANPPPR